MYVKELFSQKKPVISFEIFPPKTDSGMEAMHKVVADLASLKPDYISVTCSAGGSGGDKTVDVCSMIKNEFGIEAVAHFTCITKDKAQINSILDDLWANNIQNVLALRGDIPQGFDGEVTYPYALNLIEEIKQNKNQFGIAAAVYPEGHVDCVSVEDDFAYLKKKVDAGAELLITQLFFENKTFYDFLKQKDELGINVPITVGVMPILSRQQVEKMIFMCGSSLPANVIRLINKYKDDPDGLREAGIQYAAEQIDELIANGVDGIHIYCLNQPDIAEKILNHIKPRLEQLGR